MRLFRLVDLGCGIQPLLPSHPHGASNCAKTTRSLAPKTGAIGTDFRPLRLPDRWIAEPPTPPRVVRKNGIVTLPDRPKLAEKASQKAVAQRLRLG